MRSTPRSVVSGHVQPSDPQGSAPGGSCWGPTRDSHRCLWAIVSNRGEDYDGDLPAGVTLVDVITAFRAGVDEPRQSPVLAIGKSPEFVAFVTRGNPSGCRHSLPADLNVDLRVGADVPVPSRVVGRSAVRGDDDEILVPTCVDQTHRMITAGPSPVCGEEQSWPPTCVAADEPTGQPVDELMNPQVLDLYEGSRRAVHDAVCPTSEVGGSPATSASPSARAFPTLAGGPSFARCTHNGGGVFT